MSRGFAPLNNPPGRMHTAGVRVTYRDIFRHVSPWFRLHCHLLSLRPPAAAAVEDAASVAERTRSRRATSNPPFATHGESAYDYAPIAELQLLLNLPSSAEIPSSLRTATLLPSDSSDDDGTAAFPATPSVGGY